MPSATDVRTAFAKTLIDRYGVVGRESTEGEGSPGGFSEVYDVWKAMEEAGRVRRGYFVGPMSATQFAVPGAVDRLRALREPTRLRRTVVLAATDPANAYGAALPWPRPATGRVEDGDAGAGPQRAAGALVILHDGELIGWLGRRGETLLTWIASPPAGPSPPLASVLADALAGLVERGRRKVLLLRSIDGAPPALNSPLGSPLGPLLAALVEAGFSSGARGLQRRRAAIG
jgi:ATP-dependent Lhr-like helicase